MQNNTSKTTQDANNELVANDKYLTKLFNELNEVNCLMKYCSQIRY